MDLVSRTELNTKERWTRGFTGLGKLALTAAGAAGAYTAPINQLSNQVFGLRSFQLGGYGAVRAKVIAGVTNNVEVGLAGEFAAGRFLLRNGVEELAQIKNASGHGIDLTGTASGARQFYEVKA